LREDRKTDEQPSSPVKEEDEAQGDDAGLGDGFVMADDVDMTAGAPRYDSPPPRSSQPPVLPPLDASAAHAEAAAPSIVSPVARLSAVAAPPAPAAAAAAPPVSAPMSNVPPSVAASVGAAALPASAAASASLPASAAATASAFDLVDLAAPFPLSVHSDSAAVHRYGELLERGSNLMQLRHDQLNRLRVWRWRVLHAE